jgi:hypothetical protein
MYEDLTVKLYRYNTDGFDTQLVDFSQPGSYIELLDKVLVDGYTPVAVSDITVSSGVATMTITGHPFSRYNDHADDILEPQIGPILAISGATPSTLNGEHRCLVVDADTLAFETTAADGAATGTITARIPPLGWEKVYHDAGTHQAVYRSLNPLASGKMIHVTDDHTYSGWNTGSRYWARIQACEDATDANTPINIFGSAYVPKIWSPALTEMPWEITGNSVFFRIHCIHHDPVTYSFGSSYSMMTAYGDFESYSLGDDYNFLIHGSVTHTTTTNTPSYYGNTNVNAYKYLCRNYDGSVQSVQFYHDNLRFITEQLGFGNEHISLNTLPFPNPDNRFWYKKDVFIVETGPVIRGRELGIAQCLHQNGPSIYEHGRVVTLDDIPYRISIFNTNYSIAYKGVFMQPIVGPW